MGYGGRRIVDIRKGRQKGRVTESNRKRGKYKYRTSRRWEHLIVLKIGA